MTDKKEALEEFLGCEVNPSDYDDDTFESENGDEYLVLTDREADKKSREYILDSLWAFNADFILAHSTEFENLNDWEREQAIKSLTEMQGKLCETATGLVRCLIADIEEFVADAISEDGRGHFLSFYDGNEIDLGNGLFAYRQ